jgi:hypothetical protein
MCYGTNRCPVGIFVRNNFRGGAGHAFGDCTVTAVHSLKARNSLSYSFCCACNSLLTYQGNSGRFALSLASVADRASGPGAEVPTFLSRITVARTAETIRHVFVVRSYCNVVVDLS